MTAVAASARAASADDPDHGPPRRWRAVARGGHRALRVRAAALGDAARGRPDDAGRGRGALRDRRVAARGHRRPRPRRPRGGWSTTGRTTTGRRSPACSPSWPSGSATRRRAATRTVRAPA